MMPAISRGLQLATELLVGAPVGHLASAAWLTPCEGEVIGGNTSTQCSGHVVHMKHTVNVARIVHVVLMLHVAPMVHVSHIMYV